MPSLLLIHFRPGL